MRVAERSSSQIRATSQHIDRSTARVYESLRALIIEKKLTPGGKINQSEVAKQLSVSRTPVVKALHMLESQGLVDNIPNRGFFVHRLSILELMDLFALREAIDTIIIAELTETITDEQIRQIEDILNSIDSGDQIDESRYWEFDKVFHNLLLGFSTNNLARKVDEHFQIYNRAFIGGLLRKPAETLPEHRRILQALRERDRDAAVDAVVCHISRTKSFLQEIVKKLQKLGVDPAGIPFNELPKGSL